ncbi:OmpP1/FadL family transporter [Geovibrio thiophilus]|nr:outer membrane protein transport protein [Geovibrio thiophilus]
MFRRLILIIAAACFILPSAAFASGFAINEQGAKALGMGGAFAAQADDPTAVYYNPAGITQLEGTQVSLGFSLIQPSTEFEGQYFGGSVSGETEDKTFVIPNLYITTKINDRLSFGFGSFINFGLGMDWKDDWAGAYLVGGRNAEIATYTFNPVLAYRVTNDLSLAAGLVYQRMDVTIESMTTPAALASGIPSSPLKLEGDSDAWGWNVAAHYKLGKNWRFGLSYRPEMKHEVEGTSKTDSPLAAVYEISGDFKADITLPAVTYVAAAWSNGKWTFEFDGQYTQWSSYDELNPEGLSDIGVKPKNWDDVWALRFGGQYKLNEMVDLRAGIIRDYSPIPDEWVDPMLPSGDRWLYTVGAGFHFGKSFDLDLAYNYLDDENRKFDNEAGNIVKNTDATRLTGEFKNTDAHIFAVNLTYKF